MPWAVLIFFLLPLSAQAQDRAVAVAPLDQDPPVAITEQCRVLEQHQPAGDVAFRPGVDVMGRPVAPADLPGSAGALPAEIVVDLRQTLTGLGVRAPAGLGGSEVAVGRLTVDPLTGRTQLNGQPVGAGAPQPAFIVCGERPGGR